MVGDQAVDFSVEQLFPHAFLVFRIADRRRALRQGTDLCKLIGIQYKVVRARFTSHILPFLTGAGHFGYPFRAADMTHMQAATGDFRQIQNAANGFHFGEDRPRGYIIMRRHAAFPFRLFA